MEEGAPRMEPKAMTAEQFLKVYDLKMRITLSDTKPPPWRTPPAHHYRVTIIRQGYRGARLVFDHWEDEDNPEPGAHEILTQLDTYLYAVKGWEASEREHGQPRATLGTIQEFNRLKRFTDHLKEFFSLNELRHLTHIHK